MERMKMSKRILCAVLVLLVLGTGVFLNTAAVYAEEDNQVHLERVHTIYWKAVLRKNLKSGKKILAKAGTPVIVISRNYGRGKSTILFGENQTARVSNSMISIKSDYTTIQSEGDYNTATKEAYINSRTGIRKNEKYVVWISLDKQRVNIFVPSDNRWVLYRVYKCSSGKAYTPTKLGWKKVDFKSRSVKGLKWYTDVAGGGMHKWPGKLNLSLYGIHVASHGCVRLTANDAYEVYHMIPVKTRVLVY